MCVCVRARPCVRERVRERVSVCHCVFLYVSVFVCPLVRGEVVDEEDVEGVDRSSAMCV